MWRKEEPHERRQPFQGKTARDQQIAWLKSPNGENYCAEIRKGIDRLRTGKIEP
jgi:hypothetical protein